MRTNWVSHDVATTSCRYWNITIVVSHMTSSRGFLDVSGLSLGVTWKADDSAEYEYGLKLSSNQIFKKRVLRIFGVKKSELVVKEWDSGHPLFFSDSNFRPPETSEVWMSQVDLLEIAKKEAGVLAGSMDQSKPYRTLNRNPSGYAN